MKTLQNYIKDINEEDVEESISLDMKLNETSLLDIEELISATDAKMLEYKAKELFEKYPVKGQPGVDAYGRKLEAGDWVICICGGITLIWAILNFFGLLWKM